MSVLIKGIELPEKVQVLELHSDGKVFTRKGYLVGEAVELPDKHGRLVDADAMCNDLATVDPRYETMIDWCIRVTEAQPTIVEAEDSEC